MTDYKRWKMIHQNARHIHLKYIVHSRNHVSLAYKNKIMLVCLVLPCWQKEVLQWESQNHD